MTMRNVLWGTVTALLVSTQVVAGILVASLLVGSIRDELGDVGVALFVGFYLAAIIAGPVLGILRPLTDRWAGRALIGGLISTIGFLTQFVVFGAVDAIQPWRLLVTVVAVTFLVGAVMSPLFSNFPLLFNVDRLIAAIWHSPEA